MRWSVNGETVSASETDPNSVTIGDFANGLARQIGLTVIDPINHSFSLQKEQELIPLNCK